jgi:hypothetical protein
VAGVNLDGGSASLLLVSDLNAAVGDTTDAGKAYLYRIDKAGTQQVATVDDSSPSSRGHFGTAAAAVQFKDTSCSKGAIDSKVLVTSSDNAVFAFFRFTDSLPDPRCFARK